MKKKNIYVKLHILIPVILTGITVLSVLITYQLAAQPSRHTYINSLTLSLALGCVTFVVSYFILRLLLKPLVDFVEKTKKMPIFSSGKKEKRAEVTEDINQISEVFNSVANILSNVEAKELFPSIIGSSAAMRNIFTQIIKVAPTDSTVL
ncbi:MAG TPA: hypothetical protein PK090_12520, partial [Smithellaceae bacterium]|nr:hypothetical protein [Smithellaceae bacterium]